jgi:hypothetical protein
MHVSEGSRFEKLISNNIDTKMISSYKWARSKDCWGGKKHGKMSKGEGCISDPGKPQSVPGLVPASASPAAILSFLLNSNSDDLPI